MLITIVREITHDGGTFNDVRVIPFSSVRCFTISPGFDVLTPLTYTQASLNQLTAMGLPSGVVARVTAIRGQTFQTEDELRQALTTTGGLTAQELEDYESQLIGAAEEGAPVNRFRQAVAYFEMASAPPLPSPLRAPTNTSAETAFLAVALLNNILNKAAFELHVKDHVTDKLVAGLDFTVVYQEF